MNLLQMSITGAFMILAVVVVRALMINHLPKKTFLAMWIFVLVRLFVPLPFYSPFSIYTFLSGFAPHAVGSGIANSFPVSPVTPLEILPIYPNAADSLLVKQMATSVSPYLIIWAIGFALCVIFFAISYFKCHQKFWESLPVSNDFIAKWKTENRVIRQIEIKQSSRICTPLTYGVFKPVILLPKKLDWNNTQQIGYVAKVASSYHGVNCL